MIHPTDFAQDRLGLDTLYPLLRSRVIRGRSWRFPLLGDADQLTIGLDWIGQGFWGDPPLEYWRMYQSGQFVLCSGLREDWRDDFMRPRGDTWQPGREPDIAYTLLRFTACFEFAARLAASPAFRSVSGMHVEIEFQGLQGRHLMMDDPWQDLIQDYRATLTGFPFSLDSATIELVASAPEQAIRAAGELFQRFKWHPAPQILSSMQEQLFAR